MNHDNEALKLFFNKAETLLTTDLTMREIYNFSIVKNGHLPAFEYVNEKGKIRKENYSKVNKHIKRYSRVINDLLGEKNKNTPVVLKLNNSPLWCELFWAILMAGYKPLLINAKTSKEGTNNLISQAKASAILTDDPFTYDVTKINVEDVEVAKPVSKFDPTWEDEVIFCSSGTTGDVKLMIFNGENLCHQIASSLEMPEKTKDIMYPGYVKILAMIPFHHIFGFVAVFLWYTFYGKIILFPGTSNSKEIMHLCQSRRVTHVFSVPLFWDSLALQFNRRKELASNDMKKILEDLVAGNTGHKNKLPRIIEAKIQQSLLGPEIRFCISGGGYLSEETANTINGIGYPLYNGYGMTEIGVTSVELSPVVSRRLECSIGAPLHGVEYKIDGKEQGELLVKSEAIHVKEIIGGILKETKLDNDGFYRTGDIAAMNDVGSFFVKGRIKDVIINADGENIFPDELELFFKNINNVSNICIVGTKSKKVLNKENVTLVAEIAPSLSEDKIQQIRSIILEKGKNLPKGTKIDQILFTTNKLPMANNMKVKRHLVKEQIESGAAGFTDLEPNSAKKEKVVFDEETTKNFLTPIKQLFAEVLCLSIAKIRNEAHWINDLGGDSMNYFDLATRINERFNIRIPDEMYGQLTCVNDFVVAVTKLVKNS